MKRASSKTREFLQGVASKTRRPFTREVLKKVFLIAVLLGVTDTLVSVVGWTYLGRSSPAVLLSDLLFLEGSLIFAVGTLIAVAMAWRTPQPKTEQTPEENDENPHFSIQLIIVGAILIVLAIVVGTVATSI